MTDHYISKRKAQKPSPKLHQRRGSKNKHLAKGMFELETCSTSVDRLKKGPVS